MDTYYNDWHSLQILGFCFLSVDLSAWQEFSAN